MLIDPLLFFRHLHTRLLRPIRLELNYEIASLRQEIEHLRAELGAQGKCNDQRLIEFRAIIANLRAELDAHSNRSDQYLAELRTAADNRLRHLDKQYAILEQAVLTSNLKTRIEQLELLSTEHPDFSAGQVCFEKQSPFVSIVMPTKDRADAIVEAIVSVRAQRFTDWELIIVDDGSIDATAEAVSRFRTDPRIRYVRQRHAGESAARNHALRLAKGALIAYLDDDNLWYPDFLTVATATFAADPNLDCAYGALVSEVHLPAGQRILLESFDRSRLLLGNYIDMNVFVHRRRLTESHSGFDETLNRLSDWDLILRYTQDAPARAIPVLAARYRVLDDQRLTTTQPLGPNYFAVRRKWQFVPNLPRPPRVLYVLWHYPQLSETYVESEIRCMRRWGVHVEVWSEGDVASPYEPSVPVHRGSLTETIAKVRPDILHLHWLHMPIEYASTLSTTGLPVTVRAHGFEVTDELIRRLAVLPWVKRIYCFPHQLTQAGTEPRLRAMSAAFDTSLFRPMKDKDRRLVLRTGTALPSKDLRSFFDLAKRLPEHRFVLAVVTALGRESYVQELTDLWRQSGTPCELLIDEPRDKLVPLVEKAGLYVHTALPPDKQGGTPIGMPISIAEALATGAHVLVRDLAPLVAYVGDAGRAYRDIDHATELIAETTAWSETEWTQAWMRAVDRAFLHYADELVLRPLFDDWCAMLSERFAETSMASG